MSEHRPYEAPAAEEIHGDGSPAETCAMISSNV
jgi:hypothetical protein